MTRSPLSSFLILFADVGAWMLGADEFLQRIELLLLALNLILQLRYLCLFFRDLCLLFFHSIHKSGRDAVVLHAFHLTLGVMRYQERFNLCYVFRTETQVD